MSSRNQRSLTALPGKNHSVKRSDMDRKYNYSAFFALLMIMLTFCSTGAMAQTAAVTVGTASGLPGATVTLPVAFTAGTTSVSTLQFDLAFSASVTYSGTSSGAAATAANKEAQGNAITGGVRILVFGLNTNSIGSGTVANIQLTISGSASAGTTPVTISGVVASASNATAVTTTSTNGSVTVQATADTTPPTISSVTSSSITSAGATITWTTNEAATTQVEYGTTTGYGTITLNSSLVTSHSQSLTGLTAGTLYHYRVKSSDAAGNPATSGDYTFTTSAAADTTPPTITNVTSAGISSTGATITWSTNEGSTTQVEYGTSASYGSSTTLNATLVTSHSQSLSGLAAGTVYHYRVKSSDAAGNPATSGDCTFTTSAAADVTPPTISNVTSSGISSTGATITWTTNEGATTQIEYGTSASYGSSTTLIATLVTSHSQSLSGLAAGTLYHYRVKSSDASSNPATSGDYTFTTTTTPDTTAPTISNVSSSSITSSGATITWTTNEAANTQVEYGTSTSYGSSTTLNASLVTSHSQGLSGLTAGTLYHYRVKSSDGSGNGRTSSDYTFTTSATPDTTAPTISSVSSSSVTSSGATITWTTNEAANTQVEYGTSTSYGSSTTLNATLATSHSQSLSGLTANTLYHYRVKSSDAAGNPATSGDYTFTTSASPDTTAPTISSVSSSSVTSSGATITWTTNEAANTQVEYGTSTSYGSSTTLNATLATSHSQSLSGLTANTLYHYRVKSSDAAGNPATSGDYTFTTSATQDKTAPVITAVTATSIASSSATITWTTNEAANSQVEYGTSASYGSSTMLDATLSTTHSQGLSGLTANTQYHYRVKSSDAAGNPAISSDYTFTTSMGKDTTGPVISNVAAINITGSGAAITWTTNEAADTQVEYGASATYGNTTNLNSILVASHFQTLAGLAANTTYHYRIKSADAAGNPSTSVDYTFQTAKSGVPPVISDVTITGITNRSVTINWTTDVVANSRVEFWRANQPVGLSVINDMATTHSLTINDLQKSTQYNFRIKSADPDGNQGVTPESTFTTNSRGKLLVALPLFTSANSNEVRSAAGNQTMFGLALANMSSTQSDLTFTAVDSNGELITGPDIVNPATSPIGPVARIAIMDLDIFGKGFANVTANGWIRVESDSSDVVGFYLGFDEDNSEMDGASFGYAPFRDVILSEIVPAGSTKINLANTEPGSGIVTIDLMKADGSVRSSQSRPVNGNGAIVVDLFGDLFTGYQPDPSDYVLIRSPKGLQSFELMTPDVGDIASLSGQDRSAGGTVLYSPQYAMGGSYKTSLSIINLDSRPGLVTLQLYGGDGVQIGSSKEVVIGAQGKIWIDDPSFFAALDLETTTAGYVRIESDGIRLAGSTVFGNMNGQSFASSLPLVYSLRNSITYSQVASNDMYFTGVAVLNPSLANANVVIQFVSENGQVMAQTTQTLPGMNRIARLVTELFPSMAGQNGTSGYIRVIADKPVASFALFGTNSLSVLSAIPGQ